MLILTDGISTSKHLTVLNEITIFQSKYSNTIVLCIFFLAHTMRHTVENIAI